MRYSPLLLLLSLVLCTSCRMVEIPAQKLARPLNIDANYDDWGEPWYYFDQLQATFSIATDSQYFYLCLKTADRQLIHQIRGRGLVISINAQGKKKPQFSIVFPTGMRGRPPREDANYGGESQGEPDFSPQSRPRQYPRDSYPRRQMVPERGEMDSQPFVASELEIRQGKEKIGQRFNREQIQGLAVSIAHRGQELVYELRVPLQSKPEYPCALNYQPDKAIAVGIKIPELDFSQMRELANRSGDMPTGGGPGGMGRGGMGSGGPGGMPGGQGGPGGAAQTASQEIWFRVRL